MVEEGACGNGGRSSHLQPQQTWKRTEPTPPPPPAPTHGFPKVPGDGWEQCI